MNIEYTTNIILFFSSIASIALFFKMWKMANDVHTLMQHFCQEKAQKECEKNKEELSYDERLNLLKVGDKVRRLYDGKEMVVKEIMDEEIRCDAGFLDGTKNYPKSSLEYID